MEGCFIIKFSGGYPTPEVPVQSRNGLKISRIVVNFHQNGHTGFMVTILDSITQNDSEARETVGTHLEVGDIT